MKITSGIYKGMKLAVPEGFETRPTRERIRQSALNMLQEILPQALVLDVFAGAGGVGLEAVSRGASGAVFVENARPALKCLKENVAVAVARSAKMQGTEHPKLDVRSLDAFGLDHSVGRDFDLIWADPPYEKVLNWLKACGEQVQSLLNGGGNFVIEIDSQDESAVLEWLRKDQPKLQLNKSKVFGRTTLLWMIKSDGE